VRLLVFSDIHGDLHALEKLMATEADYYFVAGDLATWSRGLEKAAPLLKPKAGRVYVMPGNHESERDTSRFCSEHGFDTPGEYSEEEVARRLEPFAGLKPMVLICHCPPLDTDLDRIRKGLHAGSRAVREFIEREQPAYFLCGHIHEAEGVTIQMGRTRATNAGKRGCLLEL
jgi:Icc-related predicted phosphoesterase